MDLYAGIQQELNLYTTVPLMILYLSFIKITGFLFMIW